MGGWWIHDLYQSGRVVELVSWIFWVIGSITLHELAHGWAAIWQGDDTPRRLHRMTANPIVHMGPWSLLMFAVIGIAWGVMPVDPSRFRWGRRGRIVVSGAGPAMNIALAILALGALVIWLAAGPQGSSAYRNLAIFFWTGGWLNIVLAVLNLLPVPPLDGSSILSGMSATMYRLFQSPQANMAGMILVIVILVTGCLGSVFAGAGGVAALVVDLLGVPLGSPSVFDVVFG